MNDNNKEISVRDELTDFLLYASTDGKVRIEVFLHDETVWLTQAQMAELFDKNKRTISEHIRNVFAEGELEEQSVVRNFRTTAEDGKSYETNYYNLDVIISVGYRVKSHKGTQFRKWATQVLKEYIIKGFALDDERLKNGRYFGKDYFRELLERVRSIRASERRIYQQITDIFAECSIDYNPNSEITRQFYAHIQDKFHFAITGHTSAEIIYLSADSRKPLMGMMTYKNAPDGRILKSDTVIGKNYLSENEIRQLERTVSGFFDYIENIIERRNTFTMQSFSESVDKFLSFNEYRILEGYGNVSRRQAEQKAFEEYEKFNKTQKIESDFDRMIKKLPKSNRKKDS